MSDPVASEKAAELAKKEKLELSSIKGTGSNGLIKLEDVRQAIADRKDQEDADAEKAAKADAKAKEVAAASRAETAEAKAAAAAAAEGASSSSDDDADAAPRKATTKSPMRERAHLEGCPINPDRIETYEQRVPPKRTTDGMITAPARTATMAHCCDCGATTEVK